MITRLTLAIAVFGATAAMAIVVPSPVLAISEPTETCEPGYYSATGHEPCSAAPAGTYVGTSGARSATPCAAGSYAQSVASDECSLAEPGYYVASTRATAQTACLAGTFSSSLGSVMCDPAPAGSYVPNQGEAAPTPCPPGRYQPSTSQLGCLEASPGHYVSSTGQAAQLLCPPGGYQPSSGQALCRAAQPGFYVSTPGSISETPCPEGLTTLSPGATSQSACVPKPLAIEFGMPREVTRGVPCSIAWIATGGTAPYVWKKLSKLPKGLKLSKSGLISGTPSVKLASGLYFFDVEVKDAAKHVVKARLMLGIR